MKHIEVGFKEGQLRPRMRDLGCLRDHAAEVSRSLEVRDTIDQMRAAVFRADTQDSDIHPDRGCVTVLNFPVTLEQKRFDSSTLKPHGSGESHAVVNAYQERSNGTETFEAISSIAPAIAPHNGCRPDMWSYERDSGGVELYRFESGGEKLIMRVDPMLGTLTLMLGAADERSEPGVPDALARSAPQAEREQASEPLSVQGRQIGFTAPI
ncbi:MAG: hypothetical protein AB1758_24550 [Candidatus Eremiobacterota bacterium]